MPIYAQLDGDIVVAVTHSWGPLVGPQFIELEELLPLEGHRYLGEGVFEPVEVVEPRVLSPLSFRRRFTKPERIGIEWAAVDRADQSTEQRQFAAALRSDLTDQAQAKFIDLEDPDVIAGVQALESIGLIGEGRAEEILNDPVQPEERP